MNAAQAITRTLRRREQYRLVVAVLRAVLTVAQGLVVGAAIYLLLVLGLAL